LKRRKIIPYNPKLKELAKELRNNATKAEVFLWQKIKRKQFYGYDFHRQKPIDNYIVDFFCNELMLVIEIDGYSHQIVEVFEKDVVKEQKIRSLGISLLRFTDGQIYNDMENVLRAIESFIKAFEEKTDSTFD
tara:strand:- start:408 stop:806 length:399 start_codon:yes stop_codon:yes gene_type:complete